ncbi:hypothetical protein LWI29_033773 [Acer saccharum]|uniref:Uncharacterized protein n=1 Tax=Acer saccharum TaxID=4024 RepID=A0AA39S9S4_ACESA|nr:hypothetical protein LWI29_033773 [Acer saccharum]
MLIRIHDLFIPKIGHSYPMFNGSHWRVTLPCAGPCFVLNDKLLTWRLLYEFMTAAFAHEEQLGIHPQSMV